MCVVCLDMYRFFRRAASSDLKLDGVILIHAAFVNGFDNHINQASAAPSFDTFLFLRRLIIRINVWINRRIPGQVSIRNQLLDGI